MAAETAPNYLHPDLAGRQDQARLLDRLTDLRRLVRPEEIAAGCAFFASDDAAYMAGRTFQLDGGTF